ncbi:MAG TPA: YdjY domain-containing protein [Verrucomicrobiae bacterium]|nr:YdjY domain-containing protein [Verrucomicrobiae bacterium]
MRILAVKLFCPLLLWTIGAADLAPVTGTNTVRKLDGNSLAIGNVRLEAKERRIVLPAQVNMTEGPIEYVLVSALGKLHESLFKTEAEPIQIQTAVLLLLKDPISSNSTPKLRISVALPGGKIIPADSLIDDVARNKSMPEGLWNYRGSRLMDGTFIAQRDGSIISIIADPEALIESGRVAAENDENWRPRKAGLPAVGTPVKIILSFTALEKAGTPN